MKTRICLALMLLVFLIGCGGAGGGGNDDYRYPYGARPVEPDPWGYRLAPPPQQNSPETLGSLLWGHDIAMSKLIRPGEVNPDGAG